MGALVHRPPRVEQVQQRLPSLEVLAALSDATLVTYIALMLLLADVLDGLLTCKVAKVAWATRVAWDVKSARVAKVASFYSGLSQEVIRLVKLSPMG